MNILQRYVLRELFLPVVLSILFFTFFMLLRQLFSLAELLLEAKVGWVVFVQLVAVASVTLMVLTVPMAALLGTLIGIGRLTSENEILAMRAAGVSLGRIFLPVFVAGTLASLVMMAVGATVVPRMVNYLYEKQLELSFEMVTKLEPGRNYDNLAPRGTSIALHYDERAEPEAQDPDYMLRMKRVAMRVEGNTGVLAGTQSLEGTTPQQRDAMEADETLFFAQRGTIEGDLVSRNVRIRLHDGFMTPIGATDASQLTTIKFKSLEKSLRPRSEEERDDKIEPRRMSLKDLRHFVNVSPGKPHWEPLWYRQDEGRLSSSWKVYLSARNELYQRYTLPFSLLAFVLIAVPLAVELKPRAKSVSFMIAFGLIVLYYVMLTAAGAMGMSNSPLTFAAYLAPNVLIAAVGLWLFWRAQR